MASRKLSKSLASTGKRPQKTTGCAGLKPGSGFSQAFAEEREDFVGNTGLDEHLWWHEAFLLQLQNDLDRLVDLTFGPLPANPAHNDVMHFMHASSIVLSAQRIVGQSDTLQLLHRSLAHHVFLTTRAWQTQGRVEQSIPALDVPANHDVFKNCHIPKQPQALKGTRQAQSGDRVWPKAVQ